MRNADSRAFSISCTDPGLSKGGRRTVTAPEDSDDDVALLNVDPRVNHRLRAAGWHARVGISLVLHQAVFASLALLLLGIGIYGVISYTVAQRTREIGVRAALGAPSGALLHMVLTSGMTLAGVGLARGLAGALALTQVLGSLLIGVGARDPLTMIVSAAVLATVAFAACYIPARCAATLDPLVALREM